VCDAGDGAGQGEGKTEGSAPQPRQGSLTGRAERKKRNSGRGEPGQGVSVPSGGLETGFGAP
jgi:hypothetical protein